VVHQAWATDRSVVDQIGSALAIFPARAAEIAMHSVVVRGDTTVRAPAKAAAAGRPVSLEGVAASAAEAEVVAAGGADRAAGLRTPDHRSGNMTSAMAGRNYIKLVVLICTIGLACSCACGISAAQQPGTKQVPASVTSSPTGAQGFDTPQSAADALVKAAESFDEDALTRIFGPNNSDIAFTGEVAQDRKHAIDFAAEAREKMSVTVDPKTGTRAFLLVGNDSWPFPVPLVKSGEKWHFDAQAGRQELVYRRVGANELDAIAICHGYVEAQDAYALQPREGYDVNQYAQRIISTPGKQDGLAWQNSDGTWGGPIGEKIAQAIEQGYNLSSEPYHGYFFKILKGQGPDAPLGEINFVVKGVMIGGFALVAAPAEYGVTGVQTFIVSNDGVVYQKDLGPKTIETFNKMELFNPDASWTPVLDEEDNASQSNQSSVALQ
jgi:Protein of unknown function (DUF2950)